MDTTVALLRLKCQIRMESLSARHLRSGYAISSEFNQSRSILHYRKISWSIKSTVDGNTLDPPPPTGDKRPRLLKAIQDLRTKIVIRIQEIKKDLPVKLLLFFVGFYSATAFSTAIGQTGDWDVLSAGLAVLVVEFIGALMYRTTFPFVRRMRNLISAFNYWKAGLSLGLFLDSFKF